MNRIVISLLALCLVASAGHAADLHCTDADRSTWLPVDSVKAMLQQHGFADIGAVKVSDGNCYVVPATDQSGAKKTLYLDPTDGALMGME